MLRLILWVALVGGVMWLYSCKSADKAATSQVEQEIQQPKEEMVKAELSEKADKLLQELERERLIRGETWDQYKPSQQIVEKYGLTQKGDKYYVRLALRIDPAKGAKLEKAMQELGAQVHIRAGTIWTVSVPVNKFFDLTTLDGVMFVDLSEVHIIK
ncbi:MAG: hypothetical protein GXO48_04880 [Chlorobi bacterium]|nr:hypothetical protein [Chlorobiota bacterium]